MADKHPINESDKVHGDKFFELSFSKKLAFIGKICVFLISGGFAFPNIFSE